MKNIQTFISDVLLETALDSRIDDGIVNLSNYEHTQVLAEHLFDRGIDISVVVEVVNRAVELEGKYPERQAYNKEGWLVTFPSAEYKNAAIKRGTHFASDPTHGKGGMNIYYKRKGKQKRMAQQDPSQTEPNEQPAAPAPENPDQAAPQQGEPQGQAPQEAPPAGKPAAPASDEPAAAGPGPAAAEDEDEPEGSGGESSLPASGDSGGSTKEPSGGGKQEPQPAIVPPKVEAPSFVNISVEFAKGKQWNPTPYGEWRNALGEPVAVVGLSGEVVPIKSTDREELKLFAQKKQS